MEKKNYANADAEFSSKSSDNICTTRINQVLETIKNTICCLPIQIPKRKKWKIIGGNDFYRYLNLVDINYIISMSVTSRISIIFKKDYLDMSIDILAI